MSWAAHDLEPYAFQRHLKLKVAFVPLLIGSYSPDMMTKWFVYGIHIGPWDLKATDPAKFHRGWPGFGFTHSLLYGLVIGLIIWKVFGSKLWGLSFVVGQFAHALTDTGDTVGTMLLFPWTFHVHLNAWAYAGQTGRMTDAAAYFSGLGGMWDAVWIVYGLFAWRVITGEYSDASRRTRAGPWPIKGSATAITLVGSRSFNASVSARAAARCPPPVSLKRMRTRGDPPTGVG